MSTPHTDNRLEVLRSVVDDILCGQTDEEERRCGFVHLYGVSAACLLLAERRGLDAELCAVAGMLHDLATYETGDSHDHARRSAERARQLLSELGLFSDVEVAIIADAIANHSEKERIDGAVAELLKDADVLQHYLYNPWLKHDWTAPARLQRLIDALGYAPAVATGFHTAQE